MWACTYCALPFVVPGTVAGHCQRGFGGAMLGAMPSRMRAFQALSSALCGSLASRPFTMERASAYFLASKSCLSFADEAADTEEAGRAGGASDPRLSALPMIVVCPI